MKKVKFLSNWSDLTIWVGVHAVIKGKLKREFESIWMSVNRFSWNTRLIIRADASNWYSPFKLDKEVDYLLFRGLYKIWVIKVIQIIVLVTYMLEIGQIMT